MSVNLRLKLARQIAAVEATREEIHAIYEQALIREGFTKREVVSCGKVGRLPKAKAKEALPKEL